MSKLSLDDNRWSQLEIRNGYAKNIPSILKALLSNPNNLKLFQEMWPELCSEETVYTSAYAAIPYIIDIAKALPPDQRFEHLSFIGYVVSCSQPSSINFERPKDCMDYLFDEYKNSLSNALYLIKDIIPIKQDLPSTYHLLAAIAALKGYGKLAKLLNNLDCGCQECGADLLNQ